MPILDHIIGTGISPFTASAIAGGPTTLTAAGTTLATATLIGSGKAFVSIVSASGKGVALPACAPGSSVFIYNGGSNTMNVYGNTSLEAINNGGAGVKFTLVANKGVYMAKLTATQWGANLSA